MNKANKITITRIILNIIILLFLLLPWNALNVKWPTYLFSGTQVDLKYIIVGIIFIISVFLDYVDSAVAKNNNIVTNYGKIMDNIADKMLIDGLLIILAYERCLPILIPIVFVITDIIINTCNTIVGADYLTIPKPKLAIYQTILIYLGLGLTLFYNLPFELIHLDLAGICLIIATLICVISTSQYYFEIRPYFAKIK